MSSTDQISPVRAKGWLKLAALVLVVAAVGLPINTPSSYTVVLIAAAIIFTGTVSARPVAWLVTAAIVALSIAGQHLLAPPKIDEGHNAFLPGGPARALETGLPSDVYKFMLVKFDALYPESKRCQVTTPACRRSTGFPEQTFAFSADSVFNRSELSRSVTSLDFSDPVWLRLGFVNDVRYNWYNGDIERGIADRRAWMGWRRWHITMPWFMTIRLPAAMVGGELCWRGDLLWEGEREQFSSLAGPACRTIERADTGRRIFGVAIEPDTLAMHLSPPAIVRLQQFIQGVLALLAVMAVLVGCIRWNAKRTVVPFVFVGLSLLVIAINDMSFIGGMRPLDGGDDGLFYDSLGRTILQKFIAGDIYGALEGGERVFYYGGPGLRYFRAVEHALFGETYLGYLSLVLLFPLMIWACARRFMSPQWALLLAISFVAIPVGALFGTTFFYYVKLAARGFADPAAYILFIAGLLPFIKTTPAGARQNFTPAFFGALLLALGIFMKPIIAPAAVVFLGGAGLAAIYDRQWARLAGMCMGFLPVLSMALHNWTYGHVLVLFSANSAHPDVLVMPPSAYAAMIRELLNFDFGGEYITRWAVNARTWLIGASGVPWRLHMQASVLIAIHTIAVAVLIYVVAWGRTFDPWLRLIGAATVAQHVVAFFYDTGIPRYHYLSWLLTALVDAVWFVQLGIPWLQMRYPRICEWIARQPASRRLASGLERLQKMSS